MNDRVHPVDRENLRSRIRQELATFLAAQRRHMTDIDDGLLPLAEAVDAFVLGGGKRLRPAFAFWGYRGAGGKDDDNVITAVAALELVQAGALIHDDLIDASDTRRGEPSVHRRFGSLHAAGSWLGDPRQFGAAAAIILGDLCLVWSDEMFASSGLDPVSVARSRPVFDRMRKEVMLGQYMDVLSQVRGDRSVRRAGLVARYKTAKYTVEHPLLFGAVLAEADAVINDAYSAFGLPLGEAFQLRDDVLGVFGDPGLTGKPAGDDLREGKRTYLIARAFENAASPADRDLLSRSLGDPALDEAAVMRVREVIVRSGALEATEARIEALTASAMAALGTVELAEGAATVLRELAEVSVYRNT
ncbi:MAG TPA: polyprenyl synthetase family protein [Candidatus Limnocylindrales bacterium]|nr:polyprenyl synthetase family protein [Candidatus Limnocylindrales bacterium]